MILYDTRVCGRGADAGARGAGRTCAVALDRWRCQVVLAMRATGSKTWEAERKRFASTHAAR
eukprot:792994-Pleurochrysis_carterae.AAC.2